MTQFGVGQPVRRVEDRRFLTGRGRYLDDIVRPREAHAVMLRSPHAHARIRAIDTGQALEPGRPAVWEEHPGNLCFDWETGDAAAVQRAVAAARHRVSLSLVNNRIVVNSMEPRGAVGDYDPGEDSYTLWSSTQGSHFVRNLLAEHVFHVPENRIRVVTPDVGGGFGRKLFLYPEHVLGLWAAK